MLQFLNG